MSELRDEYKPCDECGADCYFNQCAGEPCWGPLYLIDEVHSEADDDWDWIHACRGHYNVWEGGKYEPVPQEDSMLIRSGDG